MKIIEGWIPRSRQRARRGMTSVIRQRARRGMTSVIRQRARRGMTSVIRQRARRGMTSVISFFFFFSFSFPSFADDGKIQITLKSAMTMAVDHSNDLKAAHANTLAADDGKSKNFRALFPNLSGKSDYLWQNNNVNNHSFDSSNRNLNSTGTLTLSQPLLNLIPLAHQMKQSEITLEINQDLEKSTQIQAALMGAQYFLNYQLALAHVAIAEASLDTLEKSKKDSESLFQTGSIYKDDYLTILLQYTQAQQSLVNAKSDLSLAEFSLAQGLGIAHAQKMDVKKSDVSHWEKHKLALPNLEESKLIALHQNDDILVQEKNVQLALINKTLSEDNYLPSLNAVVNYNRNFNYQEGNLLKPTEAIEGLSYGFQLSWNIWDWGVRAAQNGALTEQIETQKYKTESEKEIVLNNVVAQYYNIVKNLNALETENESVKTALEALQLVSFRFLNGQMRSLDLVTAQQNLTTSKENLAQTRFNLDLAWLTFQSVLGNNLSF